MPFILIKRASDPEEIYKIHEMKMKKEESVTQENHFDQLIQMCKQELSLLMENQENWQYPFWSVTFFTVWWVCVGICHL